MSKRKTTTKTEKPEQPAEQKPAEQPRRRPVWMIPTQDGWVPER